MPHEHEHLDDTAITAIRIKALGIIGPGCSEADLEDLQQEIILDILVRLPSYDPGRTSRNTFINRLIDHKIARIMETRSAAKRSGYEDTISLDGIFEQTDTEPVPKTQSLVAGELPWNRDGREVSEFDLNDLRHDIVRVLKRLPPSLRDTCLGLLGSTVSELSRETGIPRATLYMHIKKIRECFEKSGMDNNF